MRQLQKNNNKITEAIAREQIISYYHLIRKMVKRFIIIANSKRNPTFM